MTRAALYLRVSTKEQTAENQERQLRQWADRLGVKVVQVYSDAASGSRADRTALSQVLAGAHLREFDVLLIWALDRLSREGISPTLGYMNQLTAAGVRVLSHQEAWLDSSTPMWDLFVSISAFWAKQERQRIGERVRAGLTRARAQGVRLGRKPRVVDLEDLRHRRELGQGWKKIARALKVPSATLRRRLQGGRKPLSGDEAPIPSSLGNLQGTRETPVGGATT